MASPKTKPKVLLMGEVYLAHKSLAHIQNLADVITSKATSRAEFIQEAQSGAFDGIVTAYRTGDSSSGPVDAELLDALPKSLRYICQNSAGYDSIDVDECTARRIQVSNCPAPVQDATADTTMFLILGCLRGFPAAMANLRAGKWRGGASLKIGSCHDPQGKILGILGMGGIGRNLATKARAFGMKIRYHNRNKLAQENEGGAEYVDFETLLKESDVLSLNLPLNTHTRHIISNEQFKIMKRGIVVINSSRGAVMEEAALVEALKSGQVSSAGLDVFENEPEIHPGLLELNNVLLIPHMGTATVETITKMEEWTIGNVQSSLEDDHLRSIVPEQIDFEIEVETAKGTLK